ncbi:hypothetical protein [Lutispora thermophila]|uniref:Uncharacterized protein n=1 Tax=Lutispora thermophila DSM 19022 TaxID=1122184 RepID=A0A1M6BA53_9FIRM|nr:hypothetical protein [Lutispora thermophila]SHI45353.1 hypothetical protein SAMN02745176_00343 [Lutispora thermophila DSM 19022]
MGFLDDLLNDDIIWVVLLLLLVFVFPQRCSEPIIKKKDCGVEDCQCNESIIYRSTRGKRERRRLVY